MFDKFIIMLAEKIGKYVAAIVAKDLQFKTFEISSLRLEPGDAIVLRTKNVISAEGARRLEKQIEKLFPGHKGIVLEEEMNIAVLKPET